MKGREIHDLGTTPLNPPPINYTNHTTLMLMQVLVSAPALALAQD
jgi:hypothetical protein